MKVKFILIVIHIRKI